MPVVTVNVEHITLPSEHCYDIPSVSVSCSICGRVAEAFGQTDRSIKRCIVELRDRCDESNFYRY